MKVKGILSVYFFFFYILKVLKGICLKVNLINNNSFVVFIDEKNLIFVLEFFKLNTFLQFNSLVDLTAIDYYSRKNRFQLIYTLLSYIYNFRIFIKIDVYIDNRFFFGYGIISISSVYKSAIWLEREVWDLYGIFFKNHVDLRRILTDYGFQGFPLRKDFPISGFKEVRYDDSKKIIVYEDIKLTQEYRFFDFLNVWNLIY